MSASPSHNASRDRPAGSWSRIREGLLLTLAALAVLSFYAWRARPGLPPDTERGLYLAQALRTGQWADAINYHYPPLFPAVIVIASLIFPSLESAARAAGLICVGLAVAPLYLLAFTVFGRRTAVLAAGFFIFRFLSELPVCRAEQMLLPLLPLALLAGLRALEKKSSRWSLATGAIFGAAFLAKPEAWAYFLLYAAIALAAAARAPNPDRGAAPSSASRLRQLAGAIFPLLAGYFLVAGPYLLQYHHDTGRFSINPKAKTLFLIHNVYYWDDELYRVKKDENGYFTLAQRIYIEGDKKPLETSILELIRSPDGIFLPEYALRLAQSLGDIIAPWYLQRIAPWVWPALLAAGLWPPAGRERRSRAYYLHLFALLPVLTVPLFSARYPRFYFSMVPWFMIVLARGADRLLAVSEEKMRDGRGGRLKRWTRPGLLLLLALEYYNRQLLQLNSKKIRLL